MFNEIQKTFNTLNGTETCPECGRSDKLVHGICPKCYHEAMQGFSDFVDNKTGKLTKEHLENCAGCSLCEL